MPNLTVRRGLGGMLRSLVVLLLASRCTAFSSGGGQGEDDDGNPFLQTCDAIYVCAGGVCPPGMSTSQHSNAVRTNAGR